MSLSSTPISAGVCYNECTDAIEKLHFTMIFAIKSEGRTFPPVIVWLRHEDPKFDIPHSKKECQKKEDHGNSTIHKAFLCK